MEEYNISKEYVVLNRSDSLGTQPKYYKDGYWYKLDRMGHEGLAEALVSDVLCCSNISDFVVYERCTINGVCGCRSKSFLNPGEQFVTFASLYRSMRLGDLGSVIYTIPTVEERLRFLLDFVRDVTGVDCTEYLYQILTLDMLIRNPDRHFKNLGLILGVDNKYRVSPIFDNGQGLMQNYTITPPYLDIEEKEQRISAATISGSFELQYNAIKNVYKGERIVVDYGKLYPLLEEKYPKDSVAKAYLLYTLNRYKEMFYAVITNSKNTDLGECTELDSGETADDILDKVIESNEKAR